MVESIESKILSEYPGLVLNKNLPMVVTDDMSRVSGYVPAQTIFKTIISELFVVSTIEFFKPDLGSVFFKASSISKATSDGAAKKCQAHRVAHCFTLTYWGDIDATNASIMLDDIIYATQEEEIPTDRGICLLRTAIGDKYVLTQGVSIELAFPTRYIQQLERLGYDVHYIDSEKEQLNSLKKLAEAKNEEVLKGTY